MKSDTEIVWCGRRQGKSQFKTYERLPEKVIAVEINDGTLPFLREYLRYSPTAYSNVVNAEYGDYFIKMGFECYVIERDRFNRKFRLVSDE